MNGPTVSPAGWPTDYISPTFPNKKPALPTFVAFVNETFPSPIFEKCDKYSILAIAKV